MEFYGRETEIRTLRETEEVSRRASQFTVVMGRRRVGKTTLILRATEGTKRIYTVVKRVAEPLLCERIQREALAAGVDIPGRTESLSELLKALMLHSRHDPLTLIIDEFQELQRVNPNVFEDIREVWDTYGPEARINLVVSGSVHSLMVRIFEDNREPLFGRSTCRLDLRPFRVSEMTGILMDRNPSPESEDLLTLYMLTGGVPEYVALLMDRGAVTADSMIRRALSPGSTFLREGEDLLVSEFGPGNKTYLSVLQLIASGRNSRAEMEDILGTTLGEYLRRLEDEYGFIDRRIPMITRNEKLSRWVISDQYLRFYFRYVQPNASYIEAGRTDLLEEAVRRDLESYEGRVLEDLFTRRVLEEGRYTSVGGYWNRKGDVEIDIVVTDDASRSVDLVEVKRNLRKLDMDALRRKADTLGSDLRGYDVRLRGLSMEDVFRTPLLDRGRSPQPYYPCHPVPPSWP